MNESVNRTSSEQLNQPVHRRWFLQYVLLGFSALATAAGTVIPIVSFLWPPKAEGGEASGRVAVASPADLPVGTGEVYSVHNKPVIVMNTPDGYKAVSAVCTHLGCIVYWDEKKEVIACPCHEAFFTTEGAVISGPPPAPLEVYRVQVEGDQIYVG